MGNIGCGRGPPPAPRKEKKKQQKDELDRLKQAEKKRRRLEKALANSAAIRSELEKKKQKKIEEQQRLDEEGAAIAEAVALHVLCEDPDDSHQILLKKNERFEFDPWDCTGRIGILMGGWKTGTSCQSYTMYPLEGFGWVPNPYGSECRWNDLFGWSLTPGHGMFKRDLAAPYVEERAQGAEISAELVAAQAVSALQIAEDVCDNAFLG